MATLKDKVVSGLAWSGLAKLITQVFSWVSTFVVIRYLNPNDYATVGLAFAFIGFFYVLSEFGLADALIQKKDSSKKNFDQVFTATLLLNSLIFLMFFGGSHFIADFYHNEALTAVLIFVAGNLLLSSFIVIPETLMNKELLFKKRALIETSASGVNTLVTLGLAIIGFGYWAILIGQVANTLIRLILFNAIGYKNYKITTDFSSFGQLFNFGAYTFASRVIWAFYNKLDVLIIGRVFGPQLLGIYTVALQLASMPLDKISGTINQVAFSAFSHNGEDEKNTKNFFLTMRLLAVTIFPAFMGIAAVSPVLIPLLIGDKWIDSVIIIQLLSLIMPLKLISSFINTFIASKGDAKFNLKMSLLYLAFTSVGLGLGSLGEIIDMVIGLVVSYVMCFLIVSYSSMVKINCSYSQFISAIWRPILCALLMWAAILLQQRFLMQDVVLIINLVMTIIFGVVVYLCCLIMVAKHHLNDLLNVFTSRK